MSRFKNPSNGHIIKVDSLDILGSLLLGPLYCFSIEIWGWGILLSTTLSSLALSILWDFQGASILLGFAYMILIISTPAALEGAYLRRGWIPMPEVNTRELEADKNE